MSMDWCRRKSLFLLMIFPEPFRNPLQIIGFPMWGNPSIYLIMDLASALALAADCLGDQQLTKGEHFPFEKGGGEGTI